MKTNIRLIVLLIVMYSAGFATTHTITTSGFTFSPDSLVITVGDTIQFNIAAMHNALEVSKATYDSNSNTSNGGFSVPFGGGPLLLTSAGKHYYVCQVHASLHMKGIIVVNPTTIGSLTIQSQIDQDGNLATDGDRAPKNWNLSLYKDSVLPDNLVQSNISASSLILNDLPAGSYVAVEADSAHWSHISISVDGVSQGGTNANQWTITTNSGETHIVEFLNYVPYIIRDSAFTFIPESLVVPPGRTVHFVLDPMHTAREVSEATWNANDTISTGGFELTSGGGSAVLSSLGTHYYVCVPHASIGMKGKIIVAPSTVPADVVVQLVGGWDLVSLPVEVTDPLTTTLFPTATSHAFAYQGSYIAVTSLLNGPGYWLKFDVDHTDSIAGFSIADDSIDVVKGWNMIGSISQPVPALSVSSSPPGIINSQFFGYSGGYFPADTIIPGYGYWVNATEQGKLLLNPLFANAVQYKRNDVQGVDAVNRLIVRDAAGHRGNLSLSETSGNDDGGSLPSSFDRLPPPPPEGAFDVRFASGVHTQRVAGNAAVEFPILITTDAFPVNVRWEAQHSRRNAFLTIDGNVANLGVNSFDIATPPHSLSLGLSLGYGQPTGFGLEQAYPDPFNPSTTIRYRLPVESRVELRIYDVLGQQIANLTDDVIKAGEGSIGWDAARIAGGIYYVRMFAVPTVEPAKPFTAVIKVVLLK